MSSRSKKRTSHQETVTQSTPTTSKTTPSRRPPSPTAITRLQEKAELANLNDRFAAYIERVRFLEGENSKLTKIIQSQEETVTRETSNIKSLYESELADARRVLDETAKEKAKIQIDLKTAEAEAKDFKDKWNLLKAELRDKDRRLLSAEGQVSDMQARLGEAVSQRKHWEAEYNRMKRELGDLEKQLASARKQLETETLQRVDLQNRVQSMKEELDFRSQVYAQELNETRSRSTIEIEEVDARFADEYESRMKEAIQQMRAENDAVVQATREEAEAYISRQLEEIRSKSTMSSGDMDRMRGESRNYRMQMEELSSEVSKLQAQNSSQEARIRDLVNQLRRQQEEHETSMAERDGEIRALKIQVDEQISEYNELLGIKIQLDNEIATYKKLLESEEQRLNLSTSSTTTSPFGQRSSVRRTLTGRKRKRIDQEGSFVSQSKSSASYEQSASSNGPVQVYETDVHGKFVKLFNNSDEDVSMSGWKVMHKCGDDETVYKFHRTLNIKAKEYCTIWSADQNLEVEHNPPTDLIMKGKRFFSGESMKTSLVDGEGNEQACREVTRHMVTTQHVTMSDDVDSAYEDEAVEKKDKCSIM